MAADQLGDLVARTAQCSRDDPRFAGQFLRCGRGAFVAFAEVEAAFAQHFDQLLVVRQAEKVVYFLGHDFADIFGAFQFLDRSGGDFVECVEFIGQFARDRGAHVHDAQAEKQTPQRLVFAAFDRGQQICRALFAHALEGRDLVRLQSVHVGQCLDQSGGDQLVDHCFAESLDIHRSARGEMLDAAADLRRAIGIDAADCGQFRIAKDFASAGRTFLRHLEFLFFARARFAVDADHSRNHFTCLFDEDPVSDADVLARDLFLVVQRGAGHAASRDRHRLEFRHRGERAHATDLHGDAIEFRPCALRFVFVGHGPARCLRGAACLLAAPEFVELDHRAVRFEGEVVSDFFQFGNGFAYPGFVICFPEFRNNGQADLFQPVQKFFLRLRGFAAFHRPESVEDRVESAFGHDRGIE